MKHQDAEKDEDVDEAVNQLWDVSVQPRSGNYAQTECLIMVDDKGSPLGIKINAEQ